ncbi:hypothetical protein HAHE_23990 [Haloferula helveola]|uniref:Methyltransferase domain-containing protein n=1 Tax=Haloferula helveola TaxID=490095 RepID=A0ABM7RMV1_9BACT|nr:hypothetical protein HAHE_23990 [Haloferula helveola]
MRPAVPFSYPGIDGDIDRFRELFRLGLKTAGWVPRPLPAILNLACGRADETGVLVESLAPISGPLFLLGIDLRPAEIQEAKARWLPTREPDHQIEFRAGDASRVDRMRQLPPFDFIFIRHQNYWSEVEVWTRLLRNALAALKPDGVLGITSYFDREHELASACLAQLGATRIADLLHPASRPLGDAPGKSVDRRLAFFRSGGL